MGKMNQKGLEMKKAFKEAMKLKRKELKDNKKVKRAKLIVKNLPFKATEKKLRSHFEKFGEIESVNILKTPDAKLVGCGFVQFKLVQKAAKARHHLNGKPFLDRNIEVDFAKSKDKYKQQQKKPETEIKEEPVDELDLSIVKVEDDVEPKVETETIDEKADVDLEDTTENGSEEDDDEDDSEQSSESDEEEQKEDKCDVKEIVEVKPRVISNDVSEGKTVFVKNIPFTATKDDLRECMSQFGRLFYALICMDKLTEHSKGTGFVKFKNQEDAEKCLQAGTELQLLGNILDCHKAVNKSDLQKKQTEKTNQSKEKDSRNLYLLKEGAILAGTNAAKSVSATDMAKRLQLEQHKTQYLRNLNMFVSKNRLIMHNIPTHWDDKKLKELFEKHVSHKSAIKSVKIMRDLNNLNAKGVGQSKEFGFISFTNHKHALAALRSLNNNPDIFSANKRPIVSFAIDNRSIIKTKQNRLHKSRLNNPNSKLYNPSDRKAMYKTRNTGTQPKLNNFNRNASYAQDGDKTTGIKREFNNRQQPAAGNEHKLNRFPKVSNERENYVGVAATPGPKKMRSRFNLKKQAQMHHENLKKEKKMKKSIKVLSEQKRPRQQVVKKRPKMQDDAFQVMVDKYKKNLISATLEKKNKWYE